MEHNACMHVSVYMQVCVCRPVCCLSLLFRPYTPTVHFSHPFGCRQSLRLEPTEATRQKEAAETSVTHDLLSHPLRVTKSQEDLLTPDAEPVIPPKFSTPSSSKHAQPKVWDRSHSSFGLGGSSPSASKKSTTMPRLAMEHKQPSSGALGGGELPPPPHSSSSLHVLSETPEKKKFLSSPWRGHKKSKSVGTK